MQHLDEFDLIARIHSLAGTTSALRGIGDDTAVLDGPPGLYTLATVDMLVDGVHFRLDEIDPTALGRTALAVNLSDIAAMGGNPRHCLASVAVPPDLSTTAVEAVMSGIVALGDEFSVGLVGGNLTRTPGPLSIDITVLGDVPRDEVLLRSGAKPGNIVAVTGVLGERAALRLGRDARISDLPAIPVPEPRIHAGRALASRHIATATMDLSDGLSSDIHHLATASGVGVGLDERSLPLGPHVAAVAARLGVSPADLALSGGEDYELLIALDAARLDEAIKAVSPLPLTAVGRVLASGEGRTIVTTSGEVIALEPRGWRHF